MKMDISRDPRESGAEFVLEWNSGALLKALVLVTLGVACSEFLL